MRDVKITCKAALYVPNEALANAIRDEFDAQKDVIEADTMPVFFAWRRAIDRDMTQRDTLNAELVRFGHNDDCYRCRQMKMMLAARQAEMWGQIQAMDDRYI